MSSQGAPLILDDAQRRVVEHREGTLIYLGAPGTGTTTGLAHAIAERTRDEGARSVWAVTVGRRAAADLRSQVGELLGSGALPTITTIHALAFSLVATFGPRVADDLAGVRVLSGAEEDQRVRDLIAGSVAESLVAWPDSLREALPTLGMANEVRAFTARLRDLGLDPDEIRARAEAGSDPLLTALAQFAAMEARTSVMENVVDYPGLLSLAGALLEDDDIRRDLHRDVRALYVDEFHDFDSLQASLIHRMGSPDSTVVIAGDPARSIYRFRGADPRVLAELMEVRRHPITHHPPGIVIADRVHRGNARALAVATRVLRHEFAEGLPVDVTSALRRPGDAPDADPEARIEIVTGDSAADLYAHLGRILRQEHVRTGIPWSDMAVLARTTTTVSAVRRSLEAAGVPVHAAAIDLALPDEPAVAALLGFIGAAVHPGRLTESLAAELMSGPIAAADAAESRHFARQWRSILRRQHPDRVPPRFAALQCAALLDIIRGEQPSIPDDLLELPAGRRLLAVGRLLGEIAAAAADGAPPAQVLWQAWAQSLPDARGLPWPERLRRAALSGHRASGHDIDAVRALFATAERLTERFRGVLGMAAFIAAIRDQRVPAEAISQRTAGEPEAVTVLTAHHAKARSWHTVVVVDLQEGTWPTLTQRRGLLDVDALVAAVADAGPSPVRDAAAESAIAMDADRRLLYTALTRAHHRTIVAVVQSPSESGSQPSRFVDDLRGGDPTVPEQHLDGRPARPLTLTGHVADLRTRLLDAPDGEREAIIAELATLALLTDDDGRPLVAAADPDTWWHVREPTVNGTDLRPAGEPIRLSASALRSVTACPLNWFLDRQVHAGTASGSAAALGIAVHALAEALVSGELPPDPDALAAQLETIWPHLGFDISWFEAVERARVRDMLERLCAFHREHAATHTVVGSERRLAGVIDLTDLAAIIAAGSRSPGDDDREGDHDADREDRIHRILGILEGLDTIDRSIGISGRIDRIERDSEGRLSLIDVKTTAHPPTRAEVDTDLQLALYQAAVLTGALTQPLDSPDDPGPGGYPRIDHAALLIVGAEGRKGSGEPKVMRQPALTEHADPEWLFTAIADAITTIRGGDFPPRPGPHCRNCAFTALCPAKAAAGEVP